MDEKFTQSAACAGDCASCGSDCGIDVNQPTVTLTLEDDSEVVCAVLNIFSAPNDREYIALLPTGRGRQKIRTEKFTSTAIPRQKTDSRCSQTSRRTKNTRQPRKRSTNCWTKWPRKDSPASELKSELQFSWLNCYKSEKERTEIRTVSFRRTGGARPAGERICSDFPALLFLLCFPRL